jgi:hypothetical protein
VTDTDREKPHHGRIKNWLKVKCAGGLGFFIVGEFLDHPHFRGPACYTSHVVALDEATGELETRNSRYRLVNDGEPTRMPGWPWRGDKMVFLGRNGHDYQLAEAMKVFEVGRQYEVEDVNVGDCHHEIAFVGVPGRYNGVMFEIAEQVK